MSIHDNNEIIKSDRKVKWEEQLRKPLKTFNSKQKTDIYYQKMRVSPVKKKDKENIFNSNQDFESKESRRIMMNEPKPTNFHNIKSFKYFEETCSTQNSPEKVIRTSDRPYKLP